MEAPEHVDCTALAMTTTVSIRAEVAPQIAEVLRLVNLARDSIATLPANAVAAEDDYAARHEITAYLKMAQDKLAGIVLRASRTP